MNNKEFSNENCQFTIYPCNFEVKIKEVKPFKVCSCKPIILNLQIISHYKAKSCIQIKSNPKYGSLYLLYPATLIYKSTRGFIGFDLFQVVIEDEYGEQYIENIFIHAIK